MLRGGQWRESRNWSSERPGEKGVRSGGQAFGGGPARRQSAENGVNLGYWPVIPAAARRGPRGRREGAPAAAGAASRGPSRFRARSRGPRRTPASDQHPRLRGTGARALDRKAFRPFGATARAEAGRARPQGHLAERGKPSEGRSVRSGEGEAKCGKGACAM